MLEVVPLVAIIKSALNRNVADERPLSLTPTHMLERGDNLQYTAKC